MAYYNRKPRYPEPEEPYHQDHYAGRRDRIPDEDIHAWDSYRNEGRRYDGQVGSFGAERGLQVSQRSRNERGHFDSIGSGSYNTQIRQDVGNRNYGYMPDNEIERHRRYGADRYGAEQDDIFPDPDDFDDTRGNKFANNPETGYRLSEMSDERRDQYIVSNHGYRSNEYDDDNNSYQSSNPRRNANDEYNEIGHRSNVRTTQDDDVIFSFNDNKASRDRRNFHEQNTDDDVFDGMRTLLRRKTRIIENSSLDGTNDDGSTDRFKHVPSLQKRKSKSLKRKREQLVEQRSTHDLAEFYRRERLGNETDTDGNANWTLKRNQAFQGFKSQTKEFFHFELWSNSFKTIEGKFGTAVMSYFRFVKWLLFLNLYVSLVFIGLILLPHLILNDIPLQNINVTSSCHQRIKNISTNGNMTIVYYDTAASVYDQAYNCSEKYTDFLYNHRQNETLFNKVLDFLQGTGWMEDTELFYGRYSYQYGHGTSIIYNMGLFYLIALGVSSILCFLLLVRNSGKGLKQRVLDKNSDLTQFTNKVLSGWDYCIVDSKAAKMKRISMKLELETDLENQRIQWRKANGTTLQKWKIIIIRSIVNFLVICILGGAMYLIYFTNKQLIQLQRAVADKDILQFLVQYLPSVTITVLNVVIPIFFNKIVLVENYSPVVEMRMTLLRTVLLRLASLGVLMVALYHQIHGTDDETNGNKQLICGNKQWNTNLNSTDEGSIKCWETFVGQQFYKLVLVDFLAAVIPVFVVEFPRRLVFDKFKDRFKIINLIGRPEFDLPKSVLDLVYSQTLCWMGLFFSPLIPAMTVVKCFLLFYIKKLTVLQNYIPPLRPYRTSRSNSLFVMVLLISFTLSVIPLSYMIGNLQPSQSCGPFRVYILCQQNFIDCVFRTQSDQFVFFTAIRNFIYSGIYHWPNWLQCAVYFLGTSGFLVPLIGILVFVIYYYWIVSVGLQKSEEIIKEQLVQEGRDKKFVWMRIKECL